MNTVVHKLGFVVVAALILANIALLPVLVSAAVDGTKTTKANSPLQMDSPNVITRLAGEGLSGSSAVLSNLGEAMQEASKSVASTGQVISHSATWTQRTATGSVSFVGHSITGATRATTIAVVRGVSGGATFASAVPGGIFQTVASNAVAGALIRPAGHEQIPVIDSGAVLAAAIATPNTSAAATPASDPAVIWPIHGAITTLFGVPEPPYQPIHTGIDISDGKRSGITPIHPFKAGTVVQVIHEHIRLGNEVVVDHGNGLTSVYGHMYATAVQVGQHVTTTSVLGTEGTTGVSTGPHVHFEIRQNGTPVNPMHYIPGRP